MRKLSIFATAWLSLAGSGVWADDPLEMAEDKEGVVYLVSTAHLDTQWRWTIQETIQRFIPNTLRGNFRHFQRDPEYTFTFEGAFRYMLAKEYYPEDYERLKKYVARGNWRVGGSWLDAVDTNVPSPEALIRQALYGNGFYRREFGKVSRDVFLPDCFGFGYALPSIASHCGLLGFSTQKLTWGSSVGIPYDLCLWQGPDGATLLAALNAQSYVAGLDEDVSISEGWAKKLRRIRESCGIPVDYHYIGVGDQGGAVSPDTVGWVRRSVDGEGPVKVINTGSDQLFRDLAGRKKTRQKLPTYEGELLMTAHGVGCYTSQTAMKRWNRKNELLADAAERAAVAADWLGGAVYPGEKLTEAWTRFLWHGFHDDLTGTSIPQAYPFSWNDEILSLNQFAEVLSDSVGAVARALDTRAEGFPIVVYNPLSIPRQDIVEARIDFPGGVPRAVRCFGPEGEEVPAQIGDTRPEGTTILFLADVPSVGFAVYDVRPGDRAGDLTGGLTVTETTLENDRYRVTVDGNGDVAGIFQKGLGKEILRAPIRLELHDDRSPRWPAWEILYGDIASPPREVVSGPGEVRVVESGPVRVTLEVTRQAAGSLFLQRIRLGTGEAGDRVEFATEIHWGSTGTLCKAAFPWSLENPMATYDLGLGTIERGTNTKRLYEVPAQQWAAMDSPDGGWGVGVLNDCKYGWDKPDGGTLRLTLIHTPEPKGYRDQATQDIGRQRCLFAVSGYPGDWREGELPWQAARLNQPLLAFRPPPHEGALGRSFSFLRTNSRQVSVKAIKRAEESEEVVLRLQELYGREASGFIAELAAPVQLANETNGQEEGRAHLRPFKGMLACDLGPYQPRTYTLRLAPPRERLQPPDSRPLPLAYNLDGVSRDDDRGDGDIDGAGHTFPGELFPERLVAEGIRFDLGPTGRGKKNVLLCRGQKLRLSPGRGDRVYLLAAAIGGDVRGAFTVGDREWELTIREFTGNIGQWDSRMVDGKYIGNDRAHRLAPGFIQRTPVAWVGTHRHSKEAGDEPYLFCYLFKYVLPIPPQATTLTLPEDDRIGIFAVTTGGKGNGETTPAWPLYDDMEFTRLPLPVLLPGGGTFDRALQVELQPLIDFPDSEIRYTTDGSEPNWDSPLYERPILVGRTLSLQARSLRQGDPPGPIARARFVIDDTTPPELSWVASSGDRRKVLVAFSEPLERRSAEEASHYVISPGVKVEEAHLLEDLRTVELETSKLSRGVAYTLTVKGVRDASDGANSIGDGAERGFEHLQSTPGGPTLFLRFEEGKGGVAADSSGRGPPGEIRGATPAKGTVGGALRFDGEDDCVIIQDRPDLDPTEAITLASWIRAEDWKGNRRILQKGVDDSQYRLLHEWGYLRFHLSGVGMVDAAPPSAGRWHHVAGTYDGKVQRLYVDGKVVGEREARGAIAVTSDPVYVGTKTLGVGPGDFFKGLLDEVLVYGRALDPKEIAALAAKGGR